MSRDWDRRRRAAEHLTDLHQMHLGDFGGGMRR